MRVLLVEDHIDIRRLFEQVIEARGHDVTACADGESAWEAYSRRPYELVLLDWELRGEEWTACRCAGPSDRVPAATAVSLS